MPDGGEPILCAVFVHHLQLPATLQHHLHLSDVDQESKQCIVPMQRQQGKKLCHVPLNVSAPVTTTLLGTTFLDTRATQYVA